MLPHVNIFQTDAYEKLQTQTIKLKISYLLLPSRKIGVQAICALTTAQKAATASTRPGGIVRASHRRPARPHPAPPIPSHLPRLTALLVLACANLTNQRPRPP